jgi:hypothetical protein
VYLHEDSDANGVRNIAVLSKPLVLELKLELGLWESIVDVMRRITLHARIATLWLNRMRARLLEYAVSPLWIDKGAK